MQTQETPEINFAHILRWVPLILAGMLLVSAWGWLVIPAGKMLPTHSNLHGQVDGWSSRNVALMQMPILAGVVVLLSAGAIKLMQMYADRQTMARNWRLLEVVFVLGIAALGIVHVVMVLQWCGSVSGKTASVAGMFLAGIVLMLTGAILGKLRRNRLSGVRTPWSLASDVSWSKSNRLGGWLLVMLGLLVIVTVLATRSPLIATWALAGGGLILVPVIVVYSYLVWKSDPDRRPVGL